MKKPKICLFGCSFKGEDSRSLKYIYDACQTLNVEFTNLKRGDLISYIDNEGLKFYSKTLEIDEQDGFMFRGITKMIDPTTHQSVSIYRQMCLFAKYLKDKKNKVVVDKLLASDDISYTKFSHYSKLLDNKIPIIPTWIFLKTKDVINNASELPYPIIIKPTDGARGNGILRFENQEQFVKYLKNDYGSVIFYPNMIQKAVENDGDYRIVVVGDEAVIAIRKYREEHNVVANMSKGNKAEAVKIDDEITNMAINAVKTLGMDIGGVDIIEDKITGKRYVLEVNLSPQIYYSSIFGERNIGEDMIRYMLSQIKK